MSDIEKWKHYISDEDWRWLDRFFSPEAAYSRFEGIILELCKELERDAKERGYEKGYDDGYERGYIDGLSKE